MVKTKREKVQSRDAGKLATDGLPIYLRMSEAIKKEGAGTFGPSAYLNQVFAKVIPKRFDKITHAESEEKPEDQKSDKTSQPIDDVVAQLLSNNPTMSSSTFLNLLKSQGIGFTKEADSASSSPALVRGKESAISFRSVRFLEKSEQPKSVDVGISKPKDKYLGFTKFRAVMLQEGLGNFGDAYFYSESALQSASVVFEGKKIYADHPSSLDEQVRPERSVRDVLGHFENVHVEKSEDGRSQLIGDVVILPDPSFQWARSLMAHAVEFHEKFPDKDFIGLSINASGDAQPMNLVEYMKNEIPESIKIKLQEAVEKGIEEIKMVSQITEAVSCDLVTEAGAGGSVKQYLESNKNDNQKGDEMKTKVKENEKEALEKKEAADKKALESEEQDAPVDSATHDDAAQDIELIKSMLKKAFGSDEDPSEEECGMAKEAIEAYGEMGDDKEKAMEKALEFMKASKHMAAKHAEKAQEAAEEKPEKDEEEKPADEKPAVKESAKIADENIKLKGELARYKEQDKKRAVLNHVDKICKESKRSNSYTAEFKSVVKDAKSVEEVNKAWTLFEAGRKASGTSTDVDFDGITLSHEKSLTVADGNSAGINFDDCTVY